MKFSHPRRLSASLVGLALITFHASQGASVSTDLESLEIDPTRSWAVNGTDEVQRIFGGVVNGSTRDEGMDYIRELNLNSSRAFLWGPGRPGSGGFRSPWYAAQYGGKPVSREEAFARWDEFYEKGNFPTLMEEWWQKEFPKSPQVYQTELYRKWGVTEGIVLHNELDGSADRHPDAVNAYYKAYLETIARHAPWLDVKFLQFQNEPNYSHWSGQFSTNKEASEVFIRCFNRLDEFLEKEGFRTRLLGPCLASSAFFSWSGWRDWTLPVLREFRNVDYFNYQLYGRGAGEHLAWLGMLQAAGETLRGVRPRGVITETNLTPGTIAASQSFRWEVEHLFMALENPDKIALRTYFLLAYPNLKTRVPNRGTQVLNMIDGELTPTVIYWIYWVLSETRGKMLWVTPPTNPNVKAIASAPSADQLVLSLHNSGSEPATYALHHGTGLPVSRIVTRHAHMEGETIIKGETELPVEKDGTVSVTLPPGGICSVRWIFTSEVPPPTNQLEQREFFTGNTASVLRNGDRHALAVPTLPGENELAFLRMGVITDDVLMARELALTFNGEPQKVIWSAQPQYVLSRFGGFPNTWSVEIPLNRNLVRPENEIVFPDLDANYRLMYASIVYKPFPDAGTAKEWREAREAGSVGESLQAGLRLEGNLYGGENAPVELALTNDTPQPVDYLLSWKLPPSLSGPKTVENDATVERLRLAAGERKTINMILGVHQLPEITEGVVSLVVEEEVSQAKRIISRNVRVYPPLRAAALDIPEAANLTPEFVEQIPVSRIWKEGDLTATTRMAWDRQALLLAVTVEGSGEPKAPATLEDFWRIDSVEIFLDLNNDKSQAFDHDDFQLFFCPVGPGADAEPVGGIVGREVRDDSVAFSGTHEEQRFTVRRLSDPAQKGGGYTLICVIPWDALKTGFSPTAGTLVGCNIALNAPDPTGRVVGKSIVGAKGKFHDRPDGWSVLRLMPR